MKKTLLHAVIVNTHEQIAGDIASAIQTPELHVSISSNAIEALELIKNTNPDIIIADLHITGVDAWHFCRLLRSPEFNTTKKIPILITSSMFLDADLKRMAKGLGVNACISLPCDNESLHCIVTNLIATPETHSQTTALIVEDDPIMQAFLATGMKAYGYKIFQAETSEKALEIFASEKPDIVILDHVLQNSEAITLMPELKKEAANLNTIFIAITALPDTELAMEYIDAGIDAYIRKPFAIPYLISIINRTQRERALFRLEDMFEQKIQILADAESRYRDLYDHAPVGYHTIDPNGLVLAMNKTELDWLGYTADEVVNKKTIFDLQPQTSSNKGRIIFEDFKKNGVLNNFETELTKKNDTVFPVRIQSIAITDKDGQFLSSRTIVHDIRAEKQLEEQLRHAQKMESLSVMAEGIAHNFNNLLTPVLVNASDFKMDFPKDSIQHSILQDIKDAARRGAYLVDQLVTLGRTVDTKFESTNLEQIVKSTVELMQNTFDKNISINANILAKNTTILGSPIQIQQAIINICCNARDAMENGGTINISIDTSCISSDDTELSILAKPGNYSVISISDTGTGMTKEVQKRIFDPFFTTKGLANGTGLGLSMAYTIAKDHGGFIRVYSEPGEGSRFRIYVTVHGV